MAAKLFIFVGHPRETSLSYGMADAYQRGAESEGAEVRRMHLSDMVFDPDLTEGYHSRKTLEPCLEAWRETLSWCEHTCWLHPIWWGGMPAKMKGVIDRAFLPGFAMQYHENDPWWDKLLKGRSGDLILTSDAPAWFDQLLYGRPAKNAGSRAVMKFSGIKPVRTLQVGTVKTASDDKIQKWLRKAYNLGCDAGRR
ncbi:MAG: NAD(P)H-dependent oxidoreductase [Pseudomonadota bacterium]